MKMLIIVVALSLSFSALSKTCNVNLNINGDGMIFGKTNSQDLFTESSYKDFRVEDDDGFITQTLILNKLLDQKKNSVQLTVEDGIILSQAIDRAIKYSTSEKVLGNPKLKVADKENLLKVATFNKYLKEALKKSKSTNLMLDPLLFGQWKSYMEGQRYEHYFTLHGTSGEATRGVINLCGSYPPTTPECCKLKIAELNNVLSMSLCSRNFVSGETIEKVYPGGRSRCTGGYNVNFEAATTPNEVQALPGYPGSGSKQ